MGWLAPLELTVRDGSQPYITGKHRWQRMTYLTICHFGVQFVWSAEMSQASPFLLSMGVTKSQLALVLMAGPLSGLIVQPLVGLYADRCEHRLGRRRPFIIYGGLCTLLSLFVFGWCRELAELVVRPGSQTTVAIWLAVVAFYGLDFSINVVTASNRCLIIDTLPSPEQQVANAYASRLSGVSAILTMFISRTDLPALLGSSASQLKIIIIFGSAAFVLTHLVTCLTVHERRFVRVPGPAADPISVLGAFGGLWRAWKALDGTLVKPICWIQLWAWIGWFPLLFYSTTWIGEAWSRTHGREDEEEATRVGSLGLLIKAILSLAGSIVIPAVVSRSRRRHGGHDGGKALAGLWLVSEICFGLLLSLSGFCEGSVGLAIALVGLCGLLWAVTAWAPSTLLAEAILYEPGSLHVAEPDEYALLPRRRLAGTAARPPPLTPISEEVASSLPRTSTSSGMISSSGLEDEVALLEHADEPSNSPTAKVAGTVLGIHNIFVVIPQFLITFLSSILFKILDGKENDQIGIVFRIGGISSFVASLLCYRLYKRIEYDLHNSSSQHR